MFSKFRKLVRVRKDQIRYHLTLQRLFYIVFTEMIFLIFIFLVLKKIGITFTERALPCYYI